MLLFARLKHYLNIIRISSLFETGAGLAQWYSARLWAGWSWGFESRQEMWNFLFITASRPYLGPSQPPIQWVLGSLSMGMKRSELEAHHSPPSSAEVKTTWSYAPTPQYAFMVWCSVKDTGTTLLHLTSPNLFGRNIFATSLNHSVVD
jgi:hypothetical protein